MGIVFSVYKGTAWLNVNTRVYSFEKGIDTSGPASSHLEKKPKNRSSKENRFLGDTRKTNTGSATSESSLTYL